LNLIETDDWLNLSEAAEILGVHPSTVRLWADKGEVPAHRTAGGHRRFRRAEVEAWAAARREARQPAGQMIVQNALGRTRMQMAEGRLRDQTWYARLDEARKHEFRESGRRLLAALMRYLGDDAEEALEEAAAVGQAYEGLGRAAGLSLGETVRLFQFFADFLYESVLDVYQASGLRAAREWAHIHRRVTRFTNVVLVALVEARDAPR
jgi:excisionase family DNA binding protein